MGTDGGLLRQPDKPAPGRRAADQGNDRPANDLSYRHGGARRGPGVEAYAQPAHHGKPDRDQQALDQLQHPDPRRDQHAAHRRHAFEATMIRTAVRCAFIVIVAAATGAGAAEVPDPDGYRLGNYRAPTPATLRGVKVIGTDEAETIWRNHSASFVDVLPRAPRPPNLPEGTLWRDKPRADIPGSIWLPDTGYGELAPSMADYFAKGLEKATHGDRARLIVLYCLADCWMSWNAAKRALALGYSNVALYPEGT